MTNIASPTNNDTYAVIGNPIAHSKSPSIHAMFAKSTNQAIEYYPVLAPLDQFESTVRELISLGYKGANVTVPFKHAAANMCDIKSPNAFMAGAVNTMVFVDGKIHGYNTDGDGLVNDIESNLNTPIKNKRVLILGAGGAAEGVFESILNQDPSILSIANRSPEKAQKIVEKFSHHSIACQACDFEALSHQTFDIVINATSAGLNNASLPISGNIFAQDCLAYDMVYGVDTPFMQQAKANGAIVADGLGMLVEQAAQAFNIWRNTMPLTKPVMQALR